MFAEIITIGDELLIGQVVDTNSAWMGRALNAIGIEVLRITSVRDRMEEILEALDAAVSRSSVVFLTGGLGPTKDDITKLCLCNYFNTELVLHEPTLRHIEKVLEAYKIPMNEQSKSQAYVPRCASVLPNRVGSAPVTWYEQGEVIIVSLPGVPFEMKTSMSEEVLPRLQRHFGTDFILHQTFYVEDVGEAILAERLEKWEGKLPNSLSIAYLPKGKTVYLRITARGQNQALLEQEMKQATRQLEDVLKGELKESGAQTIEQEVVSRLQKEGLTLATAESCTGGRISSLLTAIPGVSSVFMGGVTSYDNWIKEKVLGVDPKLLEKHGAVSREVAVAMVKGVQKLMDTSCAISTTGVAGPGGGTTEKPVGTVWIATCCKEVIDVQLHFFSGERKEIIEQTAKAALKQVNRLII